MIRTCRAAAAAVVLLAAGEARAFTRATTTPGHPETGVCQFQRSRELTFRVNASRAAQVQAPCGDVAKAEAAVASGFATWAGATRAGEATACTDLAFTKGAPTTETAVKKDGMNLVVVRTGLCSDVFTPGACNLSVPGDCAAKLNCWEHGRTTLGLTTANFDPQTGEIFEADMELFGWDGRSPPSGAWFTCEAPTADRCTSPVYGKTGCNAVDLQAVVTHEAGHVLGLEHVCSGEFVERFNLCPDPKAVMAPTVGDVALRTLSADDVAGVCTIYPRGAATLTCAPERSPTGGGGCSTGGGAGLAALLGAALAAWGGRRRGR